jgi:hypothetical protein
VKSIIRKISIARDLILQDGWITFLKTTSSFFFGFPAEKVYLYRHTMIERDAKEFLPCLEDYEDFVLLDKQELVKLESQGYNFSSLLNNIRIALDNEAIVLCVFVDKIMVHTSRLATTEKGKVFVDNRPFKVDFLRGEACTGSAWTLPEFRGKGLFKYGKYRSCEFLRERGYKFSRNSVEISNIASQRVEEKFKPVIYAEASFRKFLFIFRFWNETPISH